MQLFIYLYNPLYLKVNTPHLQVAGFCEHGNESLGFLKGGEFD